MKSFCLLACLIALAVPASADISDNGNLVIGGQGIIGGTMTVQGSAFSVGGATFSVSGGTINLNSYALGISTNGIQWADGSVSTTATTSNPLVMLINSTDTVSAPKTFLATTTTSGYFKIAGPSNLGNTLKSNLKVFNDAASTATTVDVTAELLSVQGLIVTNLALSATTSRTGAGGIDTGSVAASTWYAVHIIANDSGTLVSTMLSISSMTPTLPAGYTRFRRIDWVRSDANKKLMWRKRVGDVIFYVLNPAGNTLSCGTAVSLASYVPPTSTLAYFWGIFAVGASIGTVSATYNVSGASSYPVSSGYDEGGALGWVLTDDSQKVTLGCSGTGNVTAYMDPL